MLSQYRVARAVHVVSRYSVYSASYKHMYVYTCMYIHTHIYIYVYVCIFIYIHRGALERDSSEPEPCSVEIGRKVRVARAAHVSAQPSRQGLPAYVYTYIFVRVHDCMCTYMNIQLNMHG